MLFVMYGQAVILVPSKMPKTSMWFCFKACSFYLVTTWQSPLLLEYCLEYEAVIIFLHGQCKVIKTTQETSWFLKQCPFILCDQ